MYTGSGFDPNPEASEVERAKGHSYGVVMGLLRKMEALNKGHTVYVDNYYTSPTLFDDLCAVDTPAVGTLRLNRSEVPVALKQKLKKGDTVFRQRDNLLALKWQDKRDVAVLSTKHMPMMAVTAANDFEGNPIVKPEAVLNYNKHMGGVDQSDQLGQYYSFSRKSRIWWHKLFFHMVNLAITNAFILHRKFTLKNSTTTNSRRS